VTCADCDVAKTNQPHGYPFRWRAANMEINGCQAHVREVLAVLTNHLRVEKEEKERTGPVF
jgi:hypothetical protein